MDAFWPGPLTLLLMKTEQVPDVTTAGLPSVAVRCPSHPVAHELLRVCGIPIAAPSANRSGRPSPTTAQDVYEDMRGRIPFILDGGACDVGVESTVLDLTGDVPTILRPGIVTKEQLAEVLGRDVVYYKALLEKPAVTADPEEGVADTEFRPKSPGMKYRHYSPKAKVRLIEGSAEEFRAKSRELGLEAMRNGLRPAVLDYEDDELAAAHDLFADLREFDRQGYDIIFIRDFTCINY
jgi:L-threonylcarbamoyladenylate synthase